MRIFWVLIIWLCAGQAFSQTYYPSGPQKNVALTTVTDGGWALCAQIDWGDGITGLPDACTNADKLMLACRLKDSATIKLLAAAPASDVLFDTGDGETNTNNANGSEWYYHPPAPLDGQGWGFAAGGASVDQNSCDIDETGDREARLCFHVSVDAQVGGYRCGTYNNNVASEYEKLFFKTSASVAPANSAPSIPVPVLPWLGYLALAGLLGVFGLRRLRQ